MGKFLFWICLFFSICNLHIQAQNQVSFYEEYIDFTVDSNYFCINGIYSFSNASDRAVNQNVIFPFACGTTEIDSVCIVNINTHEPVFYRKSDCSVNFSFMLPAKDSVDIHIYYRQRSATNNKYILTSTQSWGKPLEKAIYTLTVDDDLKVKYLSYTPDDVQKTKNCIVYFWRKKRFMPEVDFEVVLDGNSVDHKGNKANLSRSK